MKNSEEGVVFSVECWKGTAPQAKSKDVIQTQMKLCFLAPKLHPF